MCLKTEKKNCSYCCYVVNVFFIDIHIDIYVRIVSIYTTHINFYLYDDDDDVEDASFVIVVVATIVDEQK